MTVVSNNSVASTYKGSFMDYVDSEHTIYSPDLSIREEDDKTVKIEVDF